VNLLSMINSVHYQITRNASVLPGLISIQLRKMFSKNVNILENRVTTKNIMDNIEINTRSKYGVTKPSILPYVSNRIMDVASDFEHDIRIIRTECNTKWFKRLYNGLFFEVTLNVSDVIDASMY